MNGIEQLNKGLQGVFKLLAARNKVLYENSAGWSSGNITVPDADKYSEFDVYLWEMINPVRGHLVNGVIRAAGLVQGITNQAVHASVEINISVNGNVLSFNLANYMIHAATGVHQSIEAMSIKKIIGVEPIPAKILSGGGHYLREYLRLLQAQLGGVWHERYQRIKHSLAGCTQWHQGRNLRHMVLHKAAKRNRNCLGRRKGCHNDTKREFGELLVCDRSKGRRPTGTVFGRHKGSGSSNSRPLLRSNVFGRPKWTVYPDELLLCFYKFKGDLECVFDWPLEVAPERGCAA